jgi:hypothetical protein
MSDRARGALELRAILVSTRAAVAHMEEAEMPVLRARADELLGRLEERLTRDGDDPETLAAVEAARRAICDEGAPLP